MNFTGISDCELLVLKCLWDAQKPISVRTIIAELDARYDKKYKETTIYTFLSNLKKKEYVDSYKKGASYFFTIVKEETFIREQGKNMRRFWGDHVFAMFLEAAIFGEECDEDEKEKIKKLMQSNK